MILENSRLCVEGLIIIINLLNTLNAIDTVQDRRQHLIVGDLIDDLII